MTIAAEPARLELPLASDKPQAAADINYKLFLDCVHCGLCTATCPTYLETSNENDSPRGRIYLMRAVTDGRLSLDDQVRKHIDLCLDCRACESACPSGVQYGKLIEPFRIRMAKDVSPAIGWFMRFLLFHVTPSARRMRWALLPARLMQRTRLDRVFSRIGIPRLLPRSLRQLHEMLPRLQLHYGRLPELLPAEGKRRARVALFIGCAADAFFPKTTLNTARVLQRNGCEVVVPRGQGCCGALHYHAAQETSAKVRAEQNCAAFDSAGVDAIVVNAAGCGAMLKDYGRLLHGTVNEPRSSALASKVRDISEFLMELGPVPPTQPLPIKAVYHDACHLCHAQQIRKQPRQLLEMIPDLQLLPLEESEICCGAAGSYNLTQPEMAERLGQRKARYILETGAEAVFTGNVGCLLQIGRYLRADKRELWTGHPVDALWASYSGEWSRRETASK
jgi:glycolate oxidase iron-sulfur subunit